MATNHSMALIPANVYPSGNVELLPYRGYTVVLDGVNIGQIYEAGERWSYITPQGYFASEFRTRRRCIDTLLSLVK